MVIFEVQILRAIAALMVVLFHTNGLTLSYSHGTSFTYRTLGLFGSYGVDLFFVISGFIMFYSTQTKPLSGAEFLQKRALRILPIYWLLTALFFVTSKDVLHLIASLFFVSTISLGKTPLLYDGWTLEYEMLFYLCIFIFIYQFKRSWEFLIFVFFLPSAAGIFFFNQQLDSATGIHFITNPLLMEFCLGILASQIYLKKPLPKVGLGLISVAAVGTFYQHESHRLIIAGIPAFFILWSALHFKWSRFLNPTFRKVFLKIGDASYSIYLVQVFTMPLSGKILRAISPDHSADFLVIFSFFSTLAIGCAFYHLVERPLFQILSLSKSKTAAQKGQSLAYPENDMETESF